MTASISPATAAEKDGRGGHGFYRPLGPFPRAWKSLAHAYVNQSVRSWGKTAVCDGLGTSLTYGQCLVRSMVLAEYLKRRVGGPYVGVMLPPMVPAVVTNLALVLCGKIPVNLNYTTGQAMIDSAVKQCGISEVVTSPRMLERFGVHPPAALIMVEEIRQKLSRRDQFAGAARAQLARVLPLELVAPGVTGIGLDATATVIFTSGSTGDPKGVVLSHRNILSNVKQIDDQIHLLPNEVLLGVLPFFHSFGYTVTIWTALALGKKVVYHINPVDAKTIGKLCSDHGVTLIAGTPSFTRLYLKSCPAEQFKTLTHFILGAEKLKPELYRQINQWLGIEPMEGYGTTELSPVVAVNVPHEVDLPDGRRVYGNRPGTVGLPVPGTRIKTLDPETGEDLPPGMEGVIAVQGPQVMTGYLNRPEATAQVVRDGWYVTGDLGYVDSDGFLKITDRVSRFSKIAGEMVPHLAVEAAIAEAAGADEHQIAVTAIPDPKHGERLRVIHTELEVAPEEIHRRLTESSIPRLWIPTVRDFIRVDAIPLTGTGKVDLRRLREIALETASSHTA